MLFCVLLVRPPVRAERSTSGQFQMSPASAARRAPETSCAWPRRCRASGYRAPWIGRCSGAFGTTRPAHPRLVSRCIASVAGQPQLFHGFRRACRAVTGRRHLGFRWRGVVPLRSPPSVKAERHTPQEKVRKLSHYIKQTRPRHELRDHSRGSSSRKSRATSHHSFEAVPLIQSMSPVERGIQASSGRVRIPSRSEESC
jgi:hypothetical protein